MRILLKMLQFVGVALLLVSCPALSAQYAEAQNTKAQNDSVPFGISFSFTALGRTVPAGKASTTFW